ncbi:hypothetical protein ACFU99_02615 [Streptomyces sp. NPDC057654]|uniref:hypothetical protein n=1 Tax=Streptomyces sp. NPDC057654 TaxID=3346196 RepID=UPI00367D6DD2
MNPYWTTVQEQAAAYSLAHDRPGGSLLDGLPVLAVHAEDFSPFHTLHTAACLRWRWRRRRW